jgi:transketolase
MQLGIKLVGVTSGLSVGILGATHMSIEDIAIMRSIPNITVLSPADSTETVKATLAAAKIDGPVYLRLTGEMGNPIVYKEDYKFEVGKAITLKEGPDISIIATGPMVYNSLKAAEILEEQGIHCQVIDMHTIKPIDKEALYNTCDKKMIVTVEEHSIFGGLGSAVAECLAEKKVKPPQLTIGIADEYKHAGTYSYLIEEYGLTAEKIAKKISDKFYEVTSND